MKKIFTLFCAITITFSAIAREGISSIFTSNLVSSQKVTEKTTINNYQSSGVFVSDTTMPAEETLKLKETEFDFGKIPQGKPVTHIFEFVNTGSVPFSLDNVQASCGCTTPVWNKDVVAPGATAKITVGYNAQNEGQFAKPVTITYNGKETKQITIKGDVWKTPVISAPENTSVNSLKNE